MQPFHPPVPAISPFPAGFLWGVSTSAHQVEGGNRNNQWTLWEADGGIKSHDCCGDACGWWTSAEQDFALAEQLHLNALRFSVEWSRVEPREGVFDTGALSRYCEMLQDLRRRNILPIICLHHFSEPLWFHQRGGFLGSQASFLFERFATQVVRALGDCCFHWVTFNEPNVLAALGYVLGEFPPGHRGRVWQAMRLTDSLARAHARCYHAIHHLQREAHVGWAQHYTVFQPEQPRSPLDRGVARVLQALFNERFLNLFQPNVAVRGSTLSRSELAALKGSYDFVGLNVYSRFHVAFDPKLPRQMFARVFVPDHVPQGDAGVEQPYGEAYPQAIALAVERAARLRAPMYILENGVPDREDRIRPWLIARAVQEISGLLRRGFDLRGYFHWTLVDNFEWSEGWRLRFGLVSLDPRTQERIMRPSARLYASIAQSNGLVPDHQLECRLTPPEPPVPSLQSVDRELSVAERS